MGTVRRALICSSALWLYSVPLSLAVSLTWRMAKLSKFNKYIIDKPSMLIHMFIYISRISLNNLIGADIAAASVLISMGALLGRTTPIQLLIMGLIEIFVFAANEYLQIEIFKVSACCVCVIACFIYSWRLWLCIQITKHISIQLIRCRVFVNKCISCLSAYS